MKKVRIAQIGTGHAHAAAAMRTLRMLSDVYDAVGYAVVPEDAHGLSREGYEGNREAYEGVPRMTAEEILDLPGLDAVCIEAEDVALTKYARMAAERGLHIQMDKPGGTDGAEFDRLVELVKAKNLVFHVCYMYRYNPAVQKLKADVQAGKLGKIYAVEAQMNCFHQPDKRQWTGNYPGGLLYILGSHLIDLVYSIQGEPEEVIPLSASIGTDGVTAEDFGMAVFRYKNGASFVKSTAVEPGGFERRQLVVCGTKGTVELKPLEWHCPDARTDVFSPQITGVREAFSQDWHVKGEYHETEVFGRYDAMYRAFASYVRGERENPFGYDYEKGLHKLILKACGALDK